MALVMLQRHAPVAPDARTCRMCGARIDGTLQDHLLLGAPGTGEVTAAICTTCGDAVERLVHLCGTDLDVLVQGSTASLEAG